MKKLLKSLLLLLVAFALSLSCVACAPASDPAGSEGQETGTTEVPEDPEENRAFAMTLLQTLVGNLSVAGVTANASLTVAEGEDTLLVAGLKGAATFVEGTLTRAEATVNMDEETLLFAAYKDGCAYVAPIEGDALRFAVTKTLLGMLSDAVEEEMSDVPTLTADDLFTTISVVRGEDNWYTFTFVPAPVGELAARFGASEVVEMFDFSTLSAVTITLLANETLTKGVLSTSPTLSAEEGLDPMTATAEIIFEQTAVEDVKFADIDDSRFKEIDVNTLARYLLPALKMSSATRFDRTMTTEQTITGGPNPFSYVARDSVCFDANEDAFVFIENFEGDYEGSIAYSVVYENGKMIIYNVLGDHSSEEMSKEELSEMVTALFAPRLEIEGILDFTVEGNTLSWSYDREMDEFELEWAAEDIGVGVAELTASPLTTFFSISLNGDGTVQNMVCGTSYTLTLYSGTEISYETKTTLTENAFGTTELLSYVAN